MGYFNAYPSLQVLRLEGILSTPSFERELGEKSWVELVYGDFVIGVFRSLGRGFTFSCLVFLLGYLSR